MTSMKYLVLAILFSMAVLVLLGQNSGWDWVQSFGGVEVNRYNYADPGEKFNFLASDQSNNIYVAGCMLDEAIAGDIQLRGNGDFDIIVAKMNPQGQYIWAANLGGVGMDLSTGLSLDANGNAYLTGIFSGTLRLGGFTLQSRGDTDIFVAKINTDGIWQWVRQAGSQIDGDDGELLDELGEFSIDIKTNEQGSCVVIGIAHGLIQFGSHSLNCRGEEWFLASIDTNGNWIWAKSLGERINGEKIRSAAVTLDQDNVLTVASAGSLVEIEDSAVFESGSVNSHASIDKKIPDTPGFLVIAKHSMNGETIGEHTISKALLQIKRIVSDEAGSIFMACIGYGAEYGGQSSQNRGVAFVAQVDSLGHFDWIRAISSNNNDESTLNLALGSDSMLYVVSEASNLVSGFPYRSPEAHQAMLSSYDTDGNFLWAQSFGEVPSYISFVAVGLNLDKQNRIIVSGGYGGMISLGSHRLNSDSWGDAFVGKFIPPGR